MTLRANHSPGETAALWIRSTHPNFAMNCLQLHVRSGALPFALVALLGMPPACCAQAAAATPVPATPVAIENTNASFTPTDVDVPQANPARPTVSIPARLPPTGYLQFEQGYLRADTSPGALLGQSSLSQTTKIALNTRLLVQFITEPYAYSSVANANGTTSGGSASGDLLLGGQAVLHKSSGSLPTIDIGYLRRVRTGTSPNLDAGDYAQSILLLLGGDLRGGFHYDSNMLFNEQNSGTVRRAQFGQTLAITHPLFPAATHKNVNGIIELSHFTQPLAAATDNIPENVRANTADLLFAATYSLRPNLVLDAAFTHGLTSTSTQWQGSFGVTYLLPHRLWVDRHPVVIPVGHSHTAS